MLEDRIGFGVGDPDAADAELYIRTRDLGKWDWSYGQSLPAPFVEILIKVSPDLRYVNILQRHQVTIQELKAWKEVGHLDANLLQMRRIGKYGVKVIKKALKKYEQNKKRKRL